MSDRRYVSIVMEAVDQAIVAVFEHPVSAMVAADRLNATLAGCDADIDRDNYGTEMCPYFVAGQDGEQSHRVFRSIEEWNQSDDGTPGIQLEDA